MNHKVLTGVLFAALATVAVADEPALIESTRYSPTEAARAATGLYSHFFSRTDQQVPLSAATAREAGRLVQHWMDRGIPTALRGARVQQTVATTRYFDVTTNIERKQPSNRYWFNRTRVWNSAYFVPVRPVVARGRLPLGTLAAAYRTAAELETFIAVHAMHGGPGDPQMILRALSTRETASEVIADMVALSVSGGDFGIDHDTVSPSLIAYRLDKNSGEVNVTTTALAPRTIEITKTDIGGRE